MFLAIILIVLGLLLFVVWSIATHIVSVLGAFLLAIFLVALGFKELAKEGKCPICRWGMKMRQHNCECENCDNDRESDGQDHH